VRRLDPKNIPVPLAPLLPMAERWGISDDFDREEAIRRASPEDLEQLVRTIDAIEDKDLYGWLAGPESYSERPTEEYVAFTSLTMAIDSAKRRLRHSAEG
jgi:hypothetical protein